MNKVIVLLMLSLHPYRWILGYQCWVRVSYSFLFEFYVQVKQHADVKLHYCPLLLSQLYCRWENNGNKQTKLSLPRSLRHLAFGWELSSRLPTYLQSGCDEREAGSEPFGQDGNESGADEWILGSIWKTHPDGNSHSHNIHISVWGVVPRCLQLQIIETIM